MVKSGISPDRTPIALLALILLGSRVWATAPWTLELAVGHALANNPDARIAEERIAAARAGIEQSEAAFRPHLQLQSSYLRTDNPMSAFGALLNQRELAPALDFNDVPDLDNLNVRGVVTLPLYSGGRLGAGREAAAAEAEAAVAGADAVRNALAFEVARTFHTVLKTREFIRAAEAGVRSFESNLTIAADRVAAGTALKSDTLDIEVRLAQAREDLLRARHANALAERGLRNLLGIEDGEFSVADRAPMVPAPQDVAAADRPELAAIRQVQRAAEARVREAQSGHRPHVSAVGMLDYDRGWVTDGSGKSYTAGVTAQWDLWDGNRNGSRVEQARAQLATAREEERKLRLAIALETEQARLQLDEASERLAVTEAAVSQAEESVAITRARFEHGLMLASQLIDAETALTAARVRRAEAEGDRRIAGAALRKALGVPQLDSPP